MRIPQLLVIAAALGTSVPLGLAQDSSSFFTLYSFAGQPDGSSPQAGVAIGKGGVLYGTTYSGGTSNQGTVFSLTPPAAPGDAWTETLLHNFAGGDGADPEAGVVIGSGGVLYGTTYNGGASGGTVFELTPPPSPGGAWIEAVLWDFVPYGCYGDPPYCSPNGGDNPSAGVVIGRGGALYGTAKMGGAGADEFGYGTGTVFALYPPASPGEAWTEDVLYAFPAHSGPVPPEFPSSAVVIGPGGVLYGTLSGELGSVFAVTPPASPGGAWTETGLASTLSDTAAVVIGSGGVLYGTTETGGTGSCITRQQPPGCGTVYSLAPPATSGGAWTETVLHDFTGGGDGANPYASVVIGSSGVLYGTTEYGGTGPCSSPDHAAGCGTVYSLTPPASPGGVWTETVLHSFTGGRDGAAPMAGLVIGKNGVLYGTASSGGVSDAGTVFSLTP